MAPSFFEGCRGSIGGRIAGNEQLTIYIHSLIYAEQPWCVVIDEFDAENDEIYYDRNYTSLSFRSASSYATSIGPEH